jgi:hypothetical protein
MNCGTFDPFCPCSYSGNFPRVFEPEQKNICVARQFLHGLGGYAIRIEPSGKGVLASSLLRKCSNPVTPNLLRILFLEETEGKVRSISASFSIQCPTFPQKSKTCSGELDNE